MTTCFLAPDPVQSTFFIPGSATPGNGVLLFTYSSGTSTKVTVYKDSNGATPWTNPIVLDSGGNLPNGGVVWIPSGTMLTVKWCPSNDTDPPASPYRTIDAIAGVNDVTATGAVTEWVNGPTPTFVGASSFSLSGDQTSTFHVGRRTKTTNTGGTVYGRMTQVTFASGSTTVLQSNDSGSIDSGLSAVSYGFLAANQPSVPVLKDSVVKFYNITDPSKTFGFSASTVGNSTNINLNVQNTSGSIAIVENLQYTSTQSYAGLMPIPDDYITGFMVVNSGSSNAMDINAGFARDSTNLLNLRSAAFTNKTQATWAAGASTGAKLSAAVMSTNCWYYWYAIGRNDGYVDFGFDTSTTPTMPATSYTFYRYLGARRTTASTTAWEQITQHGEDVYWKIPKTEFIDVTPPFSASTVTLNFQPPNKRTKAYLSAELAVNNGIANTTVTLSCYFSAVDNSDAPVVVGNASTGTMAVSWTGGTDLVTPARTAQVLDHMWLFGAIRYKCATSSPSFTGGSANSVVTLVSLGWQDPRGKPVG